MRERGISGLRRLKEHATVIVRVDSLEMRGVYYLYAFQQDLIAQKGLVIKRKHNSVD